MKYDLIINGKEAELDLSVMDHGHRVVVFATVGFITGRRGNNRMVSHTVYEDFSEYYNATDRPKRLTQAFKNKMLNGVDVETVKRHVCDHYNTAA